MFQWVLRTGPVARMIRFWRRYEHHINLAGLVLGFIFDSLLATRPDNTYNNILLVSYLGISGAAILILNMRSPRIREGVEVEPLFLLLILQFCFGGLASNLFILYIRSGTFAASTLFFFVLGSMILANEFMRSRYAHLRFNVVIFYLLLFSYLVIALPTYLFHSIGVWQFLASGGVSLAAIAGFLVLLYYVLRRRERHHQVYEVSILVGLVFLFFNGLYFLHIIPPVPLSLRDIGVYHSITKSAPGEYTATYEQGPWFIFWRNTSDLFTIDGSQNATCYSSVFAPTGLMAPVFHRWQKYNDLAQKWETVSRASFPISGGRGAGYRGWTLLGVSPGHWRCNVETESGALIGRVSFTVIESPTPPVISTKTL